VVVKKLTLGNALAYFVVASATKKKRFLISVSPEWSGKYCERDVDECSGSVNPCVNGATCANEEGGYKCICVNGYEGENCETNVDDCASK
jgi:hypothetical protein